MNEAIPVQILGVQFAPEAGTTVVLLGEAEPVRHVVPIFIGPAEAQSIVFALQGIDVPRPGTHDLFVAALLAAGVDVSDVVIVGLRDGTFIAELGLQTVHGPERVDARPSDCIALAVRAGVPISIVPDVFAAAAVEVTHPPGEAMSEEEIDRIVGEFHQVLDQAEPDDFGT